MYLAMRDVIASRMFPDWRAFLDLGLTAMEVRIEPDLTLKFVRGEDLSIRNRENKDKVVKHLDNLGVAVKGVLLNTKCDGTRAELEWMRAAGAFAAEQGVSAIRFDCHRPDPGTSVERERLVDELSPTLEALLDAAAGSGVGLALENHGPFTNRPEVVGLLLDRFSDRGLSLCLDTGNFYVTGGLPLSEVYAAMDRFAPHVTTTHLKNAKYPAELRERQRDTEQIRYQDYSAPIEEGDVDHAKVCEILKRAGYDGPLFYEDEHLHWLSKALNPTEVMQTTVRAIKKRLGVFLIASR